MEIIVATVILKKNEYVSPYTLRPGSKFTGTIKTTIQYDGDFTDHTVLFNDYIDGLMIVSHENVTGQLLYHYTFPEPHRSNEDKISHFTRESQRLGIKTDDGVIHHFTLPKIKLRLPSHNGRYCPK